MEGLEQGQAAESELAWVVAFGAGEPVAMFELERAAGVPAEPSAAETEAQQAEPFEAVTEQRSSVGRYFDKLLFLELSVGISVD